MHRRLRQWRSVQKCFCLWLGLEVVICCAYHYLLHALLSKIMDSVFLILKNRMQIHLLVPTATTKLCLKTWWLRTAQYFHFPAQIWNQARLQTAVQSTCTRMCHSHMMRCGPWPWPWREQTTTSPTTPPHLCAASVTAMLTLPMPFLTLWSWPTLEEYRWVRACTRGLLGVAVLYLEM